MSIRIIADHSKNLLSLDEKYMLRCIEIAKNGLGTTAPNPMVGAVLVLKDKIIGEGYTSPFGGSHAEVNAIQSVIEREDLKRATLYVTLEPCSHHGKTPPCADLIIRSGIKKVVIGLLDPHDKVAGRGIQKLKDADCEVVVGVLEDACRNHHKRFLTFHKKKRPYIILKWAETADGFIAPEKDKRKDNPEPYWITSALARQLVHQWRAEEQAILVGTNTVLEDNPKLNVRDWKGTSPLRVVLDKDLKIQGDHHVLDKRTATLVLTQIQDTSKYIAEIRYEVLDFSKAIPDQISDILWKHNQQSVLIEGGGKTLQTFIDANLWDEARVFEGNTSFKNGVKAPLLKAKVQSIRKIGEDTLKLYYND